MFGLTRRPASVRPSGPEDLQVEPVGSPAFTMSVARLPWVMFLRSGDAYFADEAGWWVFAHGSGALALSVDCPGLEGAVRGPLRPALDGAQARLALDLAKAPAALRGKAMRAGWASLDAADAAALRADPTVTALASVADALNLP